MIQSNAAADPAIHDAARSIAERFTAMLSGILRPEEVGECRREAYMLAREVIEELAKQREKP